MDSDLEAEQRWLDIVNQNLVDMQNRTASALASSDRAVRAENTVDARVAHWHMQRRKQSLALASGPIAFGKIQEEDESIWYVGG